MLNFQPITLGIKELVESYTFKYGEGSCQHSFVSSYTLKHKYGDMFCEHEGFLYTLRSRKCSGDERVYLFPHEDRTNTDALRTALQNVLDDAHKHSSRVKFETLTQDAKDIVCSLFPGKFEAEAVRDYSEYVYSVDKLKKLPGMKFKAERNCIHQFFRDYKGRYEIRKISPEHIDMLREFQAKWLAEKITAEDNSTYQHYLLLDDETVQTAFDDYFALGLSGIVIFIDGALAGYAFGSHLSDSVFDTIAEKGSRSIRDIYLILKRGLLTMCCEGCKYFNYEEDIGVEGLRMMKMKFKPEHLMTKFILTEK